MITSLFPVRGLPTDRLSSNRVRERHNEGMSSSNGSPGWENPVADRPKPEARLPQGRTGAGSTLSSRFQGVNRRNNDGSGSLRMLCTFESPKKIL